MKKIITFFSVLTIAFAANAQNHDGHDHGPVTPANPAVIAPVPAIAPAEETLVIKEADYDFGRIPQGKPVTHVFEVSNSGKVPYKLDNVHASCGCTTPQWDKDKTIGAGEKSDITVGYNAAAEGFFTKTITVTYNTNQTKVITIKGEVWKTPAASAPANAGLNDIKN